VGDIIGLGQNFKIDGYLGGLTKSKLSKFKIWISTDHTQLKIKSALTPIDLWDKCGSEPQVKNSTAPAPVKSNVGHISTPMNKTVIAKYGTGAKHARREVKAGEM
jgi:hypothetical protein